MKEWLRKRPNDEAAIPPNQSKFRRSKNRIQQKKAKKNEKKQHPKELQTEFLFPFHQSDVIQDRGEHE